MNGKSFYKIKLEDPLAAYFTDEFFHIKSDGTEDVSRELQRAIDTVVSRAGYGVLFVPEGEYLLSRTIYVPKAVRIIGYGENRPTFILKNSAEGFSREQEEDKGGYKYLFWFVNKVDKDTGVVDDANPGTFYSAISNVNVSLGEGNPYAVAFRSHYAQNCFISHVDIEVMSGMAGVYDVGNEMEDVFINGGRYGIITTKCSPGWPFVMTDTRFYGQTSAAINTREAGLNIIRTYSANTSKFIDVDDGFFEKIYIEDSVFEDMNCLLSIALDKNELTQINVKNCQLKAVENIVEFKDSQRKITNEDYQCIIKKYVHGIVAYDTCPDKQMHDEIYRHANKTDYQVLTSDFASLPLMDTWVNARDAGLAGDGKSDDTQALKDAVEKYDTIYFPQGEYILSDTIKLKDNTAFIGMNPVSTQLILKENSEKFTGFGKAKAFVESGKGQNILFGLGINTGGRNPRACSVKWMADKNSYMNDIKFFGGHGNLIKYTGEFDYPYDEGRARDAHLERVWDYQYPSLLICDGGGGRFKDIWSASPYVSAGLQIQNTQTEIKIYCLSLEHHCRCELRMVKARNVTIYGFQTEEEKAEGEFALPIEMQDCRDITFATTYCFRTVFVQKSFPYCAKVRNCKNIRFLNVHNYSQMKYTMDNFLLDENRKIEIRPWQAAMIYVTGDEENKERSHKNIKLDSFESEEELYKNIEENLFENKERLYKNDKVDSLKKNSVNKLFDGFRFADGGCCDSKGNFYFLDCLDKRVYRIDGETLNISMIFESPYKVDSIGFDTRDNIVIIGEYTIPKDATLNGHPVINELPPDSMGTSYGYWYDSQAQVVPFTVNRKGEIEKLEKINIGDLEPARVLYPGNRWRDGSDFEEVVQYNPGKAYLAPDGATIIPCHYDLIRANNLTRSKPGRHLYSVDEMHKRVYSCDILSNGLLTNPVPVIEEGTYCTKEFNGKIYVADDNIKVYEDGKLSKTIYMPERPVTFDFGGSKKNSLFVTTGKSIYLVKE